MKRPLVFPLALLVATLAHNAADPAAAIEFTGTLTAAPASEAGRAAIVSPAPEPKFQDLTIDDKVQIGYGVAVADVDGDKLPDILLADKKQFVWYRNPGPAKAADPSAWQKHILAENLTPKDNVCIAARDLDGDGKCEVAVGAEWNPGDTENSGAVFYLIPPADRTQLWTPVKLQHEPTVHRMKWIKNRDGKWCLVVVPLHGRGNVKSEGAGVKILSYLPPANLNDPKGEWKTEAVNPGPALHVTHNLEPILDAKGEPSRGFYVCSKEGAFAFQTPTAWDARPAISDLDEGASWAALVAPTDPIAGSASPVKGMGELRRCSSTGYLFSLVAVEPFHGNELVDYVPQRAPGSSMRFQRRVLTDKLVEGHALACGDLLGQKISQVVIGWRGNPTNPNPNDVGIKIFTPSDAAHSQWRETLIDNKIACEDLVLADLNGDGKLDIVGAGRATHNLKIYLNQTAPPAPVAKLTLPKNREVTLSLTPATGYSSPGQAARAQSK
jgi:hypothetical protein